VLCAGRFRTGASSMFANFAPALAFTLGFEGGYVNHPADPGGHTNKGITLATLRRYKTGASVADLKAISDELVRRIYKDGYWDEAKCDGLDAGVDGAVFDYAVTSGPATARKNLLKVIGGPAHETVRKLCARRLSIYQTFKTWKTFGKGWTRRVTAGEALWVKWALAARVDAPAVKQKLEDEASKAGAKATQQNAGAAGTGGATASAPAAAPSVTPEHVDQLAGWILGGVMAAGILIVAFLVWRAHVNRQREKAYAAEAATV
jgi:lysozyme family protein